MIGWWRWWRHGSGPAPDWALTVYAVAGVGVWFGLLCAALRFSWLVLLVGGVVLGVCYVLVPAVMLVCGLAWGGCAIAREAWGRRR